uniref:Uncharacterized protein n=1 Tax=Globodera rostochiensis TaxID=31243 RepID=A0A914HTY3_GLORO
MFFTMFSNSLANTDRCQVIPPGRYKMAVWDRRLDQGEVSDCDRIFKQSADGQRLLKTMALDNAEDWKKMCFNRFELVTTDESGQIDPYNVTFYKDNKPFCAIKHKFNIHLMPLDENNNLLPSELKRVKAAAEDVFMLKGYLNFCLQHDANHAWDNDDLELLRMFGKALHKMIEIGKLTIRSQLAMAAMHEDKVRDELNRWELCAHVDEEMAKHAHILAMFQRWLDGELWENDALSMKTAFSSLMSNIIENNEKSKMIDAETKTLIAQIGFIVIKALNKTQTFESNYKPKFDVIVDPLAQLYRIGRPNGRPTKEAHFQYYTKPSFSHKNFFGIYQMSMLNRIGNALELALKAYPDKTLEVMNKYGMDKIVCKFCIARPPGRTSPQSSSWLLICELIQWQKWMNLTSDLFLAEMHNQIAALVGDAEVNCLKKMDVVDKSVLNIIGSLLMAKVLRDGGKTFLKFTKLAEKTICKFCANRTTQFYGWNHICVYNMWLMPTFPRIDWPGHLECKRKHDGTFECNWQHVGTKFEWQKQTKN